jgi:hypothetical protein
MPQALESPNLAGAIIDCRKAISRLRLVTWLSVTSTLLSQSRKSRDTILLRSARRPASSSFGRRWSMAPNMGHRDLFDQIAALWRLHLKHAAIHSGFGWPAKSDLILRAGAATSSTHLRCAVLITPAAAPVQTRAPYSMLAA